MIRRTVRKAFGSGEDAKAPMATTLRETGRGEALERLFHDLFDALESGVAESLPSGEGSSNLRLTKPRVMACGIEFYLEGPGALFRFLHPLRGFVEVSRELDGVTASRELLLLQLQRGSYRPAQKPLPAACRGGLGQGLFSTQRTPFRYTSVPELARHYLAQASGSKDQEGLG